MCGARYSFTTSFVVIALVVLGAQAVAPPALAQEGASGSVVDKGAREQELREQIQKILHELEELQQPAAGATAAPVQPSVVQETTGAAEESSPEAIPQYELADVSIVSSRVQRRPEGITLSATARQSLIAMSTTSLGMPISSAIAGVSRSRSANSAISSRSLSARAFSSGNTASQTSPQSG